MKTAHVLAAAPLGQKRECTFISGRQPDMDYCRNIGTGILSGHGVADRFAQIPFFVTLAHPLLHGIFQVAVNMHFLAQGDKNSTDPCILAGRYQLPAGNVRVSYQQFKPLKRTPLVIWRLRSMFLSPSGTWIMRVIRDIYSGKE